MIEEMVTQVIEELPTMREAIRACVRHSGLTDKLIYLELGIDGGNWSRIMNGQAYFPQDKLIELMKICSNDIPLLWLAKQCGYELKVAKFTLEEQLEKERKEKLELQNKLEVITEFLRKANFTVS